MKKTLFVACCACAALAFCGRAAANVTFGITEDTGVLGDPTMFYSTLNDLGATENRIARPRESPSSRPSCSSLRARIRS